MKPEPRRFTRESPCTKFEIWGCFRGQRGWKRVQVDQAHATIGLNAPRYMIDRGYLERVSGTNADMYSLTEEGEDWLLKKFRAYLRNHPEDRDRARNVPKDW